jgi:hypothetical protein
MTYSERSSENQEKARFSDPYAWSLRARVLFTAAMLVIFAGIIAAIGSVEATLSANNAHPDTPTFSLPSGYYDRVMTIRLRPPYPGATILFTNDGSVPTWETATRYSQPILLTPATSGVTVIRARAVLRGETLGPVVDAAYVIGLEATLPIVSLIVDPPDLWDEENGIYANPWGRGRAFERPATMTFIDSDRTSGFQTGVGIRVHGFQSRAYAKKSFRVYFRSDYGMSRLDYPIFDDYDLTSFDTLVLHNGGQDLSHPPLTNWTLMRNQLDAALAFEMNVPATHSRAALLFLNGEPWGIFQIRERIDDDFLSDTYGLDDVDLIDSPESFLRHVKLGDRAAWNDLMAHIEAHDLSSDEAYAVVAAQVNIENFINYHCLEIYSANTDWPAHNALSFRPRTPDGRWRWIIWDSDNSFAAEGFSQIETDMLSHLLDFRHPETEGRDTLLFRRLLDNDGYRVQFASTLADLLNTVLAPEDVIAKIDALAVELAPDIAFETHRWTSATSWSENVQELREYAIHRPSYVREHAVNRLGLPGTMDLTIQPPASGKGHVTVNGHRVEDTPWHGVYFQSIPVTVKAVPHRGYTFDGWEEAELPQEAEITLEEGATWSVTPRFRLAIISGSQP